MSANLKESADNTEFDPRWASVVARDATADGTFYYSVQTTGVFCKPSCASKLARPENVHFHLSIKAAQAAGFRACKRCRPGTAPLSVQHAEKVTAACRSIEQSELAPNLTALAQASGLSAHHFHRVFKAITGLTPKAYANAHRAGRVRAELVGSTRVTDAIYDAGFASNARFYENADAMLGMKPAAYRDGGANAVITFAIGQCSLGAILVAQSAIGICAILLGDDADALARQLQTRFPKATLVGDDPDFELIVATVVAFIESPKLGLNLPLDVRGTAFQQRVWNALRQIPPGTRLSYAELAKRIDQPSAVRAVASACAANAIAVAIPCHRIVRSDGALSGYAWGVERKTALLAREG